MADPLSLVRKVISAGEPLTLTDGFYNLSGHKFAADTRTAFKRSLGGKNHCIALIFMIILH